MEEKTQPLVSIIIACYNGEKYIDSCMQALLNQTYSNIEIIVCDDASLDNSLEKLLGWQKKDKRIRVVHNAINMYAGASRNRCIEESNGEYCAIQDIDDISAPNRVEVLLNDLLEKNEIAFVSSQMSAFIEDYNNPFTTLTAGKEFPTRKNFLSGQPFNHPATMFRTCCLKDVGGYRISKETRKAEDYDLYMRLYAKGYKGHNLACSLYYFRLDSENIKRRDFEGRIGEHKVRLYGYKLLKMMPWAYIFTLKPYVAHFYQKVKFRFLMKKKAK